jgi:NTE family protein
LEALEELGIRPAVIAGTSIGAIVGATFASGLEARQIHAHVQAALRSRAKVMAKLMRARVGRFSDLVLRGRGNPVLLDAETCLDLFWPDRVPAFFSQLSIPLLVVATDFHACREVVFSSGALAPAVASSMAIPGLFRPVESAGRILIDGGAVNPLPYDLLFDHADIVIAVDVTFGGRMRDRRMPTLLGSIFGSAQIMQGAITAQKVKLRPPDILLRPGVERFNVLEFMRAGQILQAAESAKDQLKRALNVRMEELQRI